MLLLYIYLHNSTRTEWLFDKKWMIISILYISLVEKTHNHIINEKHGTAIKKLWC